MNIKRIIDTGNKTVVFTIFRYLAGFVFIPSGLVKIQGHRFSAVFVDIHSHTFFDGFFIAEIYWIFFGYCQLFIAFLLFTQRLTAFSAVVYFTTVLSIFLVTLSYTGESLIASIFLLVIGVFLLLFDWCKVKSLFGFYPNFKDLRKYRSVSSKLGVIGLLTFLTIIMAVIIVDKPY